MPTDFVIRSPRLDESTEIADLLRERFKDEGPEIGGTVDTPDSIVRLQQTGHPLIMEIGGRIVGFVCLDPARDAAFKLAVHPDFKGKDYGEPLMEAAEAKAKALGWEQLLVGVLDTKQKLVPYYIRLGYAETGERKEMETFEGYAGPSHDFIILSKSLGE